MKIRQPKPTEKKRGMFDPFGEISVIQMDQEKPWVNSTEIILEKSKSKLHAILQPTKMKRSSLHAIKPILKKLSIRTLKDTLKGVFHKKSENLSKDNFTPDEHVCKLTSFKESKSDLSQNALVTAEKQSNESQDSEYKPKINSQSTVDGSKQTNAEWEKAYIKKAEELANYHDLTPFLDSFLFDVPSASSTHMAKGVAKTKKGINLMNPVISTITLSSDEEADETSIWETTNNAQNGSTIYITTNGSGNDTTNCADLTNDTTNDVDFTNDTGF